MAGPNRTNYSGSFSTSMRPFNSTTMSTMNRSSFGNTFYGPTSRNYFSQSKVPRSLLPKPPELIDLSFDDQPSHNNPSMARAVVPFASSVSWSQQILQKANYKIQGLKDRIINVLDAAFGPRQPPSLTMSTDVNMETPPSIQRAIETPMEIDDQDDDDIQVLSESISKRCPVNTLARDFDGIAITKEKWLNEHKSSYSESRRERAALIEHEQKTLAILQYESKVNDNRDERIRRNLTLTNIIELEKPKERLPDITEEMEKIINRARGGYNQNEVLMTTPANIQITRGDIKSLAPTKWLNDNVINSYLDMIALRSKDNRYPSVYVFTTFFYPKFLGEGYSNILKRWTRKVDIFSYDLLIFPIHLNVHWCLACADLRHKTIKYYDSLGGKNFTCLKALLSYLSKEHDERKKCSLNTYEWNTEIVEKIPQQENGSDCGMFACKFAEYLSRDSEITFSQEHMNYYRERMIYEIMEQKLLYP